MDERRLESLGETAQRSARRVASDAQDMAARAQERAQEMAERAGGYANARLPTLTGRPAETWMRDAQRFVQQHPMQALAITVGLGFLLGKILARD